MDTFCMEYFLNEVSKRHKEKYVLMVTDGAACHGAKKLKVPENIKLLALPPYSPDFNPQENIWDEIREKFFKNVVFDSMNAVETRLTEAALYLDNNPGIIKSISSWNWITEPLVISFVF
jgi:transposase